VIDPEKVFLMEISAYLIAHEALIRVGFFAVIFSFVAIAETIFPRRILLTSKPRRWASNLLMQLVDVAILRFILPVFPVGIAFICSARGWGVLNYLQLSATPALIIGILALDLTIYIQHMMFHLTPLFWRAHMVHHTDRDIDVTTGVRFHPVEIIISLVIKLAVVAFIGVPPLAVLIFEILLNGTTMFNHGNLHIGFAADRIIRMILVTPDMHRVHHSVIRQETNSNYGFNFSFWDRLFGTYRAQPAAGHDDMKIGLNGYHDERSLRILPMLMMPFTYGRK
jgi:sterol desaturase/sphingolipid hydroxylase (fatty acid hydroxylase superfamily)